MELLVMLAKRHGELIARDEIAARLWGDGVFVDTDRNINNIVRKLRQAFKDDPENPRFLETIVGKGYRFTGPLEIIPSESEHTQQIPRDAVPAAPSVRRRHHAVAWSIVFLAAIAVAIVGVKFLRSSATDAGPARSIAILPLENLSGDTTQDYFADGMTEELTTELAQAEGLRVIAHVSVLQYKGSRKTVREIARELNVDALIEGSVLRSADRVRITAQLIRTPSDRAIWARSYERDLRDVLSLQRDVAEDIAEHVKIKLTPNRESRAHVPDPQSYDLYLQGLFHYQKSTEADLREAVSDFQKAISRDPDYAAPYAGEADAYVVLGTFYWPAPQSFPLASAAARKALELDPKLSEAHVALGSVNYYFQWDWAAAEREAKTALELNSNNAFAHDLLGAYYCTVARTQECFTELQRAMELAPGAAAIVGDTVFWAFFSRNYDLAISNGEAAVTSQPSNAFAQVFLGMAYAKTGQVAPALKHADLAKKYDSGPLIASFAANVYALAGRRNEAESALHEIEKQRVEHYSCGYEIGTAYVLLEQIDRGFRWLDNAYQARSNCMILLKVDPRLDAVRSDTRYQQLLHRVGLAD